MTRPWRASSTPSRSNSSSDTCATPPSFSKTTYESAIIFLAVLEANGRQNIRAPWFREQYADVRISLPAELARPVSRQAVAQSLGISRETVRRKIAALVRKGFLESAPGGGVITTRGVIGQDTFVAAQKRVIGYVRQFRSDLRRHAQGV